MSLFLLIFYLSLCSGLIILLLYHLLLIGCRGLPQKRLWNHWLRVFGNKLTNKLVHIHIFNIFRSSSSSFAFLRSILNIIFMLLLQILILLLIHQLRTIHYMILVLTIVYARWNKWFDEAAGLNPVNAIHKCGSKHFFSADNRNIRRILLLWATKSVSVSPFLCTTAQSVAFSCSFSTF